MRWIALSLGRGPARVALHPITAYFLLFSATARSASNEFLRKTLGRPPSIRDVYRHFHTFSATILDRVYLLTGREQLLDIRIHSPELVLDRVDAKQGFMLLGSHLGSFEVLRALGINRKSLPLKVLLATAHNATIMRVLDALNPQIARSVISMEQSNSILKVHETLEQGGIIGILGDRAVDNKKTLECNFFDAKATFPTGPTLLAVTLKVPIVLFFGIYRGGNRYDIFFETLWEATHVPRRMRPAVVEDLTRAYAVTLERHAKAAPYNWFNFYDFWRAR